MISILYFFVIIIVSFYIIKKLDFTSLITYFIIGFLLSGAFQSILIFVDFQDIYNYGLTEERPGSYKPKEVIDSVLLKSLITWFLSYTVMYIGFILAFRQRSLTILYNHYISKVRKINVETYKVRIVKYLVFFIIVKILISIFSLYSDSYILHGSILFTKYVIPLLVINLVFIFPYVKKDKHKLKIIIYLFIIITIITNVTSGSRGELFKFILPLGLIVLIFYKSKIRFINFFIVSSLSVFLFGISSFLKYVLKLSLNNTFHLQQLASFKSMLDQAGIDNFFTFLISITYARFNNMQALYWFYYDQFKYGCSATFQDVGITFISLLNNLIPPSVINLSHYRELDGMALEQWLFYQATGGNAEGGYALPPIVEALWGFQNLLYALLATLLLYFLIGIIFKNINKYFTPIFPILLIVMYELFVNPESINAIYHNLFRGILFAATIQYLVMKKIKS